MESGSPRAVAVEMSSHGLNSTGWDFVSGFAAGVTELITPCQWNQPGAWQFVCLSLFFLCLPSKCNREWSNEPRLGMSWFAPSALFFHCILPAWQVQLGSGLSLLCSAPFRWCQGLPVPGDSSLMPLSSLASEVYTPGTVCWTHKALKRGKEAKVGLYS